MEQQLEQVERELSSLRTLLEPGVLYAPPTVLYYTPEELPGFETLLARQRAFEPRLKCYLQKRYAARYGEEQQRKAHFIAQYQRWHRHLQKLEAHDPSSPHSTTSDVNRAGPLPHHHESIPIGNAVTRASRRSMGSDAVRSEEEMNRVLLSLLEQERENPATRWMATLAITPSMLLAHPKNWSHDYYVDRNGNQAPNSFIQDPQSTFSTDHNVIHVHGSIVWTRAEEKIFVDKFLAYPKNFRKIASFLPYKTTANCVAFYYRNKKRLRLKQLRKLAANEANLGKAKIMKKSGTGPGRPPHRKPGRPPKNPINAPPTSYNMVENSKSSELSSATTSLMSLASLVPPSDAP